MAYIEGSSMDHFLLRPTAEVDTALDVLGFIPEDDDPRWAFVRAYASIHAETRFKPINFANAMRAKYLSDTPSFHAGFATSASPENTLQQARALDNLAAKGKVFGAFAALDTPENVCLVMTEAICNDTTRRPLGVTPCPEALYQLRASDSEGYLARVGFNIHAEEGTLVMSVANIQGVPGAEERNKNYKLQTGKPIFNQLVKIAQGMAPLIDETCEVRGIIDPARGNSGLYWAVFNKEGIVRYHAAKRQKPVGTSEV